MWVDGCTWAVEVLLVAVAVTHVCSSGFLAAAGTVVLTAVLCLICWQCQPMTNPDTVFAIVEVLHK